MMYGQSIEDGETTQGHIPRLLGLYMTFLLATTLYGVFIHLFLILYGLDMYCFNSTLIDFLIKIILSRIVLLIAIAISRHYCHVKCPNHCRHWWNQ